jgi:glycosyltransferase involved in cell wall biosynthesis
VPIGNCTRQSFSGDCSLIRVAHIIGSTGLYGAERWILALMRSIDARQAECTLVNLADAAGETSTVVKAARSRNLRAVDFPTGGRFNPFGILLFSGWVRRSGFDILHAHGYKSDIYGLCAAMITGRKAVSTPHGWSRMEKGWKIKMYESVDRVCLRFMDCACPLSPELREDLRRCGVKEDKNVYIRNGVDLDEIDAVRPQDGKPNGMVLIGYVGRLVEGKNIPDLLRAFRSVKDGRGNMRLVVVGEGPLEPELRRTAAAMAIEDSVLFAGYRSDALSLLKTFDVLALPSRSEGIPRSVMEAMAAGVPVVASDIPGNRELVEHRRTGLLFPADDTERLAEAILYLVDHPADAREMSVRARERMERHFSAGRMSEEYLSLYREVSGTRRSGRA